MQTDRKLLPYFVSYSLSSSSRSSCESLDSSDSFCGSTWKRVVVWRSLNLDGLSLSRKLLLMDCLRSEEKIKGRAHYSYGSHSLTPNPLPNFPHGYHFNWELRKRLRLDKKPIDLTRPVNQDPILSPQPIGLIISQFCLTKFN